MITVPLTNETIVEGCDAIEQLERLSKQELNELVIKANQYREAHTELATFEFLEQLDWDDDKRYVVDFLLDNSLDVIEMDLEIRNVSITPAIQTELDCLKKRFTLLFNKQGDAQPNVN